VKPLFFWVFYDMLVRNGTQMKVLKNFAVFEGGDGSGTTTQIALLQKRAGRFNIYAVPTAGGTDGFTAAEAGPGRPIPALWTTAEPTAGPVGRLIRSALNGEAPLQPETLARLFAADRCEHLYAPGGVLERCGRGELVVCDRYSLSSLVYQGIECGDALPRSLNASFPAPELLIFFDIDPEIAAKRLQSRPSLEIYERLEFQRKVRKEYHSLLGELPEAGVRVVIIDAAKSPEEVSDEVWGAVSKMPIFKMS
jgi:dTMP kinase